MSTPSRLDTVRNHEAVVLRSSCDACTEVKMACSRGKPTCARCARRGEVCIYGPMKRAGRKKQQQQQHDPSQQQSKRQPPRKSGGGVESRHRPRSMGVPLPSHSSSMAIGTPSDSLSSHQPLSLDLFMHVPEDQDPSDTYPVIDGTSAFTLSLPSKGPTATRPATTEPLAPQIESENDSRLELQNSGQTSEDALSSGAENGNITINTSAGSNIGAFTPPGVGLDAFDDSDWMFWSPSFPQGGPDAYTPPHSSAVPSGSVSNLGSTRTSSDTSPSDNCLALALSVLSALTPPLELCPGMPSNENNHRQDSTGMNVGASNPASNTFDDIMQRNLASIDAISPILKCPCAMNSSVVLILSHIIFQILWWYSAAAGVPCAASWLPLGQRTQLPQVPPPIVSSMPGYDLTEEGTQERVICQTVLSKMHSVRTLVESLSRILLCDRKEATHSRFQGQDTETLVNLGTSPPSGLAISLESELRRCLRDVSRAVVAKLAEV
jgi:hypothetical protein